MAKVQCIYKINLKPAPNISLLTHKLSAKSSVKELIDHLCTLIPCGSTPPINLFCPCTLKLPDPLLAVRFSRDARPGIDNPPPELMLLPMFPPPTMFPIELVIRGPAFPKIGDTPNPGTAFLFPIPAEVGRIPGIELPTPFVLLLNPGFPTTLIPPLFVTPECP